MDDEESILEVAGEILEWLEYTVMTARNGEEAVHAYEKALHKHLFDVVIIDLTIPGGMGGEKTVQKLLKIDPFVKAVISSGFSNHPVVATTERIGLQVQ